MTKWTHIMIGTLCLVILGSAHVSAQEQKPYVGSKAFKQMKQLVGSWEGMMDMGKGPQKITATYRLTSGGSAIVETVFEGAPHEMVTVYHDDSHGHMQLTHYCMLGNQPKMSLTSMTGNTLTFDLVHDADINVEKDMHMHAAAIRFDGHDQVTQNWTKFESGKEKKGVELVYTRVK